MPGPGQWSLLPRLLRLERPCHYSGTARLRHHSPAFAFAFAFATATVTATSAIAPWIVSGGAGDGQEAGGGRDRQLDHLIQWLQWDGLASPCRVSSSPPPSGFGLPAKTPGRSGAACRPPPPPPPPPPGPQWPQAEVAGGGRPRRRTNAGRRRTRGGGEGGAGVPGGGREGEADLLPRGGCRRAGRGKVSLFDECYRATLLFRVGFGELRLAPRWPGLRCRARSPIARAPRLPRTRVLAAWRHDRPISCRRTDAGRAAARRRLNERRAA